MDKHKFYYAKRLSEDVYCSAKPVSYSGSPMVFNIDEIRQSLIFAKATVASTRNNSHNGNIKRKFNQQFVDILEGKLGEIAVRNQANKIYELTNDIDWCKYPKGKWDEYDLNVIGKNNNEEKWQIKTTGYGSQFLLLTAKDYSQGYYGYNNGNRYDKFILQRVNLGLYTSKLKKFIKDNYKILSNININELATKIYNNKASYDDMRYITGDELEHDIVKPKSPLLLKQGTIIMASKYSNGGIPLQVDNYYVQMYDMHKINQ